MGRGSISGMDGKEVWHSIGENSIGIKLLGL